MKSRLLGIAVVLVALAVIVNALALQSASITNKMTIQVAGNGTSMIGITSAGGGQDGDVSISDTANQAILTLADPLQPGSTYTFDAAFSIENRSANAVNITLPTMVRTNGVLVTFAISGQSSAGTLTNLASNQHAWIKMTVDVAEGSSSTLTLEPFVITVTKPGSGS